MAVVISLKLVYTPVDDNVTAPHKSQVTSHVIEDQGGSDRRDLSVSQIELRLSRVGCPVERSDLGPGLAFRQNTPTTSKLPLSHKSQVTRCTMVGTTSIPVVSKAPT